MPPWAARISAQLQSIRSQLEMQNGRWQRIEHQLETQNSRMSNMEAQTSQIGVLQRKLSVTDQNLTFMGDEIKSMSEKMREYDKDVHFYSDTCDNITKNNTVLGAQVNEIFDRLNTIENTQQCTNEKVIDIQWRSMRDNLIFFGIPESSQAAYENCEVIIKKKTSLKMEMKHK